jgi:hypothetical protein
MTASPYAYDANAFRLVVSIRRFPVRRAESGLAFLLPLFLTSW